MTTPRPDWYPDLLHPTIERWWNGRAWGNQTREAEEAQPARITPPRALFTADTSPRPPIWMTGSTASN